MASFGSVGSEANTFGIPNDELCAKLSTLGGDLTPTNSHSDSQRGMTTFLDLESDSDSSSIMSIASPTAQHPTPLQAPPKKNLTTCIPSSMRNSRDLFLSKDGKEKPTGQTPIALATPEMESAPALQKTIKNVLDLSTDASSTETLSPPGLVDSGSASSHSEYVTSGSDNSVSLSPDVYERRSDTDSNVAAPQDPTHLLIDTRFANEQSDAENSDMAHEAGHKELESLLRSVSQSHKACVLRPRRGPFSGQLIALTCRSAGNAKAISSEPQSEQSITLPSGSDVDDCSVHVRKIRTAMREWGGEHAQPEIWIPLQSMPMVGLGDDESIDTRILEEHDEKPDVSKLMQWLEEMSNDTESLIMSMQMVEPAKRNQNPLRRKPVPSASRLSTMLMDTAVDEKIQNMKTGDDVSLANTIVGSADDTTERFSLSAIQQLFFRASMNRRRIATSSSPGKRFSQSILLQLHDDVDSTEISPALEALVTRHAMLRARFRVSSDTLAQVIQEEIPGSYNFSHHHAKKGDEDVVRIMENSQSSIDIIHGPVFAADHIHASDGRELLFLVAHHLVVDIASWKIIIHDLDLLLQHKHIPTRSLSFPDWISHQARLAARHSMLPQLPFDITPVEMSYWGLEKHANTYGSTERHNFTLSSDTLDVLQNKCNRVFRTETADILLAALLLSFCQSFPDRSTPTIWKQEVGREETDDSDTNVDETVGWFTTLCPITATVNSSTDLIELLKLVKDTRVAVPRRGIPYFNAEFASSQSSDLASLPVEIMFNCVDSVQQLHRPDGLLEPVNPPNHSIKSLISDIGPDVGRIAVFEISVVMDGAGAHIEVIASKTRHSHRLQDWMHMFEQVLNESVAKLPTMDSQLTLADAPLIKTTYKGLQTLSGETLSTLGIDGADDVETILPISPMQQEILVAQTQDTDNYHVRSIYELRTPSGQPVDRSRLCDAWGKLVSKHVALRSVFIDGISENGLFDQLVLKKVSPNMLFLDSTEPEEALGSLPPIKVSGSQPHHRLVVIQSADQTLVCIDASQAIIDSRSISNLMHQLQKMYMGADIDVDTSLLTAYLYHVSTNPDMSGIETIIRELKGATPCILPHLGSGEARALDTQTFELGVTRKQLNDFCRYQEIEANIVLQLAWALVLRIYTGMDEVYFGCELPGRDEDLSDSIGSFAAVFPAKVDLSPTHSIRQCLRKLGLVSASLTGRQNLTTSAVEHALDLKGKRLYNTCLSFQSSSSVPSTDPRGFTSSLWSSASSMDCDLSLHSGFFGDCLHAAISSRDVSHYQIGNVIRSFEQALKTIIDSPKKLISEVDLFTNRDYAHLAWEEGTGEAESIGRVPECLHHRIMYQARLRPNAVAVAAQDGSMTYYQMSKFVTSLGVYLVNLGVRPGVIVPVILEKSWWAPIIILGVLQAGGTFVCLDAAQNDPDAFDAAVRKLEPSVILTAETAWAGLNGKTNANIVVVNNSFFSSLPPQISVPAQNPSPDHAACILYSASSSKTRSPSPRSIFYTHASLCSAFQSQGRAMHIDEHSRVLQLSAFGNDISLVEILGTMFHGGCVCIPAPNERGHNLERGIVRMGVTWCYMTTVLARKVTPDYATSLKTICFRTRKLDDDIKETWVGKVNLLLAYGAPDVCPLGISVSEVAAMRMPNVIPPPLVGKYWILSPHNPKKLMPVGAIGELAIDSPILTPHKFTPGTSLVVADPVVSAGAIDKPRPRSLRTGHKVRYLDDGTIEFLSSIRDEVVVGGEKIPTAEVEDRLRKSLGRGIDVALEAITTVDGVTTLVAFLETRVDPKEFEKCNMPGEKRATLMRTMMESTTPVDRIPLSHVPSIFIPLQSFPLSSSLKINRRKLQKIVSFMTYEELLNMSKTPPSGGLRREKPLPLTLVEEKMRRIWAMILNVDIYSIRNTDSFIGLGASRQACVQLVKECRNTEFPVQIKNIVAGQTLSEICKPFVMIEPELDEVPDVPEIYQIIEPKGVTNREVQRKKRHRFSVQTPTKVAGLPEVFIRDVIAPQVKEQRANIADVAEASPHQVRSLEGHLYKIKASLRWLILNFNGPLRYQKLEGACQALVKLHPILKTAFAVHERKVYQVHVETFRPEFDRRACGISDLSGEAKRIVNYDQATGYKLRDPITKFYFLDAGHQGTLVVRLSSAQVDDHSVSHLVQDLTTLFKTNSTTTSPVTLKRWSFFDYVRTVKFSNYLEGLEFWKEQLDGASMTHVVSHSKPVPPTSRVRSLSRMLKVDSLADYGLSFDTVLKTAWGIMLATLSGDNDVVFGEGIHGQNISRPKNVDISSMVGPVANVIPVRIQFPDIHTSPLEIMKKVQEQRVSSRPFEAIGGIELIQKCTDWPYWTRFSTVVQHRPQALVDGRTTLNMGNTTFTYTLAKPDAMMIPDIMAQTTMDGPENVEIDVIYSESRVPRSLADQMLSLVEANIAMLTQRDPIGQPILKPAGEIKFAVPRIPVRQRKPVAPRTMNSADWVSDEQRVVLQKMIQSAWDEHINPLALGVMPSTVHETCFYEIWGSLLPAAFFAEHLNKEVPKLAMSKKLSHKVHFTAEEMIENPTMQTQYDLVVMKLRDGGALATPVKKKAGDGEAAATWAVAGPTIATTEKEKIGEALKWRKSIRKLAGPEGRPSVRDIGTKASGWMRHKVSVSHDSGTGRTGIPTIVEEKREPSPAPSRKSMSDFRSNSRRSLLGPYSRSDSNSPGDEQHPGATSSSLSLHRAFSTLSRTNSMRSTRAETKQLGNHPAGTSSTSLSSLAVLKRSTSKARATTESSKSKPKHAPSRPLIPDQPRTVPASPPPVQSSPPQTGTPAQTAAQTPQTPTRTPPLPKQKRTPAPTPRRPVPAQRRESPSATRRKKIDIMAPITNLRTLDPIAEPIELGSREITRSRYEALKVDPMDGLVVGPDGMIIAELDTPAPAAEDYEHKDAEEFSVAELPDRHHIGMVTGEEDDEKIPLTGPTGPAFVPRSTFSVHKREGSTGSDRTVGRHQQ